MSTRLRVFAMAPGGHAGDEVEPATLDEVAHGFSVSRYASDKAPNRGSLHVQVVRWLTAPVADGGCGGVRLSERGMAALLDRLRTGG